MGVLNVLGNRPVALRMNALKVKQKSEGYGEELERQTGRKSPTKKGGAENVVAMLDEAMIALLRPFVRDSSDWIRKSEAD